MSWYGGAFGGEKVAPITVDAPISSFSYSNQIAGLTNYSSTITVAPADHASIRHRIRSGTYFRKGSSLHPTQGGFELFVNFRSSGSRTRLQVRMLHNIDQAVSPYSVITGKKYTDAADYNTALGTPTRLVMTALGTGVQYDSSNSNSLGGIGALVTSKTSNSTRARMITFQPSSVLLADISGNTDKINYLDAFIDALSGGGTLRTEVFYS